ncbi:unnamed protein product [Staurois parvus]|uniref:Uncharacterized protein n=1 Tax=Staurois parvus TaxID=386267 RepID=A0ABN9EUN7_9NEOB|nr:unnamed protein product [Staurois parvus]
MTTVALTPTPNQPTDAAAVATTVSHPGTTTTSVDSTLAKTEASVRTTPLATTIAGPPGTVTTSSNKVPTAASSTIVPDKVTSSSAGHVTFTKQPATSLTVTTISQYSASPAGNSVTSPSGSPKQPERTGTTEASQISNATKGDMKTTASSIVTEATTHSRVADLPKGTMITTPALSSSASPPSKTASPTTAGVTQQIMTTTSATAKLPSSSSSVPSTATDLPTPEEFTSKKTTETNKVKRPLKNIEVKCTNITTQESYVKINIKGSAICDTDSMHTADGHPTGDTISLLVCKALKTRIPRKPR